MLQHEKRGSFAKRNQHSKPPANLTAQVILYFGLIILVCSILYLAFNFSMADSVISSLLPFMISGSALIVISQIIRANHSTGNIFSSRKKK